MDRVKTYTVADPYIEYVDDKKYYNQEGCGMFSLLLVSLLMPMRMREASIKMNCFNCFFVQHCYFVRDCFINCVRVSSTLESVVAQLTTESYLIPTPYWAVLYFSGFIIHI